MAKKLSLNVAKSNVLAFRNKNRNDQPFLNLHINEEKLNKKSSAKYLGLIFYNKLLWYHHLDHDASKLIKSNGLLVKLRQFIPPTKFNTLYNEFNPTFGSLCWSSAAHSILHHIEKPFSLKQKLYYTQPNIIYNENLLKTNYRQVLNTFLTNKTLK